MASESSDLSQIEYDDSESFEYSRQHSDHGFGSGLNSFHQELSDSPYHKIQHHKH